MSGPTAAQVEGAAPPPPGPFYIVDMRREWALGEGTRKRDPFITLWGPNNCGYVWDVNRAGVYTLEQVNAAGTYLTQRRWGTKVWSRFPVPVAVVDVLVQPNTDRRCHEGRPVPVLENDGAMRYLLRKAKYLCPAALAAPLLGMTDAD